jgi:hypothetical protein
MSQTLRHRFLTNLFHKSYARAMNSRLRGNDEGGFLTLVSYNLNRPYTNLR